MSSPAGLSTDTDEQISLSVARAEESALPPLLSAKNNTSAPSLVACSRTAPSVESSMAAWFAARTTPKGRSAAAAAAADPPPPPPLPSLSLSTDEQLSRTEALRAQSPQVQRRAQRSFEAWAWTRGQQERQRACTALRDAARASSLVETGEDCYGDPREEEEGRDVRRCLGARERSHSRKITSTAGNKARGTLRKSRG